MESRARSLSTHINKEPTFVIFVCSDEAAFRFSVVAAGKIKFDSAV